MAPTEASADPVKAKSGRARRRQTMSNEEIREAAARVFLRKGYAKATLAEIAAELGRPKGSIHYHIASKEDLLFEILDQSLNEFDRSVSKLVAYPLAAVDRLRLVLREHVNWVLDPKYAYTATATERELAALKPEHLEIVSNHRRAYRAVIYQLIRDAAAEGSLQVENVTIAARSILSIVVQLPRWYSPEGALTADEMADALWRLMLNGLRGTQAADKTLEARSDSA
jgi:AcrR family transcriptional regulator